MEYRILGNTDIDVSEICLGTMTWGQQNTPDEAFQQMDYALEQGVNFFDTAELYSIPAQAKTYGRTEEIIGNWLNALIGIACNSSLDSARLLTSMKRVSCRESTMLCCSTCLLFTSTGTSSAAINAQLIRGWQRALRWLFAIRLISATAYAARMAA